MYQCTKLTYYERKILVFPSFSDLYSSSSFLLPHGERKREIHREIEREREREGDGEKEREKERKRVKKIEKERSDTKSAEI
jgi:hypothetical protein